MTKKEHTGIFILRVSLGILMLLHGIAKIMHPDSVGYISGVFSEAGLHAALAYLVYVGEVVAPIMLIIGWRTRIAALLIAGTMLVVAVLAMPEDAGKLTATGAWGLETQALFFFGSVALMFTGGSKYALSQRSKWD